MTALTRRLGEVALLVSLACAIVYGIRILANLVLNVGNWYWAGALVNFAAPVLLTATLLLHRRLDAPESRDA